MTNLRGKITGEKEENNVPQKKERSGKYKATRMFRKIENVKNVPKIQFYIFRSHLPGRTSAWSRLFTKLVAAITMIPKEKRRGGKG